MLFEETQKILFCSDLFHQVGDVEPLIESDAVLERSRAAMIGYQSGPLMDYMPYTQNTKRLLGELADLKPETLAIMHGSSFRGNGERLLQDLGPWDSCCQGSLRWYNPSISHFSRQKTAIISASFQK